MGSVRQASGRARKKPLAARHPPATEQDARDIDGEDLPLGGGDAMPPGLTSVVGENLRRLRKKKDLSLEALARVYGVSRAMLGQIELGQSAPTINVLWRIASALRVPFSAMLRHRGGAGTRVMSAA